MPSFSNAADVRLLIMDVDGVLTDGSIMLDDSGGEIKRFSVRDGLGITTWLALGFQAAVVTRRAGAVVEHRMRELGISHILQGSLDKGAAVASLCERTGIPHEHAAFVGDDWPDLPALRAVGFPVAVADADAHVRAAAALVTRAPGGHGAIREIIETILEAKGLMHRAMERFGGA